MSKITPEQRKKYNETNKANQKEVRRLAKLALESAAKIDRPLQLNFKECPVEILTLIERMLETSKGIN